MKPIAPGSPISIDSAESCAMWHPTPPSSSRPRCRGGCSIASRGRRSMRAGRNVAAAALVLLLVVASCAKKPAVAPVASGTPKFGDFVYPAGPAALADPAIWDQQRAAWNLLQSGDTKTADRQFAAILKLSP